MFVLTQLLHFQLRKLQKQEIVFFTMHLIVSAFLIVLNMEVITSHAVCCYRCSMCSKMVHLT